MSTLMSFPHGKQKSSGLIEGILWEVNKIGEILQVRVSSSLTQLCQQAQRKDEDSEHQSIF